MSAPAPTSTLSPEAQAQHDAESNLPWILGVTVTLHVLALISVTLRVYVRTVIVKVVGMDDYTMMGAMLCAVGGMITLAIQATLGLGHHQDTIDDGDLLKFRQSNFFYTPISAILGLNLVKISISFLLMRFVQHRWYKRCLWTVIIFMVAFTLACWGTVIFRCMPIEASWDRSLVGKPGTYCYPLSAFTSIGLMNTGISIATDVLLATLPIHIIWKLQINQRQKVALIGVLSLGYAAVACGIVKAVHQVNLPNTPDQTFEQGIQVWGFIQLQVSIIAACMPALRPFFQYFADTISSRSRTHGLSKSNPTHGGYFRQNDSNLASSGLRSIGGGGGAGDMEMQDYHQGSGKDDEGTRTQVTTRDKKSWVKGDTGSEENILPYHGVNDGGIVRTTEFIVK